MYVYKYSLVVVEAPRPLIWSYHSVYLESKAQRIKPKRDLGSSKSRSRLLEILLNSESALTIGS